MRSIRFYVLVFAVLLVTLACFSAGRPMPGDSDSSYLLSPSSTGDYIDESRPSNAQGDQKMARKVTFADELVESKARKSLKKTMSSKTLQTLKSFRKSRLSRTESLTEQRLKDKSLEMANRYTSNSEDEHALLDKNSYESTSPWLSDNSALHSFDNSDKWAIDKSSYEGKHGPRLARLPSNHVPLSTEPAFQQIYSSLKDGNLKQKFTPDQLKEMMEKRRFQSTPHPFEKPDDLASSSIDSITNKFHGLKK